MDDGRHARRRSCPSLSKLFAGHHAHGCNSPQRWLGLERRFPFREHVLLRQKRLLENGRHGKFSKLPPQADFDQHWQKARKRLLREEHKHPAAMYFRQLVEQQSSSGWQQLANGRGGSPVTATVAERACSSATPTPALREPERRGEKRAMEWQMGAPENVPRLAQPSEEPAALASPWTALEEAARPCETQVADNSDSRQVLQVEFPPLTVSARSRPQESARQSEQQPASSGKAETASPSTPSAPNGQRAFASSRSGGFLHRLPPTLCQTRLTLLC